jgi:hypothetical protein
VLVQLPYALKAERVTARQWNWFFIVMIVRLEANATLENLIHLFLGSILPIVKRLLIFRF